MSLTLAIQSAVSGLQSTQRALQVTSENIANVNTDGYSRKDVSFSQTTLAGVGVGVEIAAITRTVDEFLLSLLSRARRFVEHFN